MKFIYVFIILFVSKVCFGQEKLDLEEQLLHCTVRIYSVNLINGGKQIESKTGTGFFYQFDINGINSVPVIITNKHVIENGSFGVLHFTLADSLGNPEYGSRHKIVIRDFGSSWVHHPDTTVDLSCLPLAPIVNNVIKETGRKPYFKTIPEGILVSEEKWKKLNSLEEVIMIGYPLGLWDYVNNTPLFRSGVTSTPPKLNYNNRPEFLIDIPAFKGSSGSPVFIKNESITKEGSNVTFKDNIYFAGVLYATPKLYSTQGEAEVMIDTIKVKLNTQTEIPINLGTVIKSTQIHAFRNILGID